MCEAFVEIKQCLHQTIDLMQVLYGSAQGTAGGQGSGCCVKGPWLEDGVKRLEEDLWSLEYSSQKAVVVEQARIIWDLAVRRRIPTRWFTRIHRPVTVLLSAICERAGALTPRILNAEWGEDDFARVTRTVGRLAGAPLRMADARERGALLEALPELFSVDGGCCVVCDWPLDGQELRAVGELRSESELSFVFPGDAGS
jgi:hypothetical protein